MWQEKHAAPKGLGRSLMILATNIASLRDLKKSKERSSKLQRSRMLVELVRGEDLKLRRSEMLTSCELLTPLGLEESGMRAVIGEKINMPL